MAKKTTDGKRPAPILQIVPRAAPYAAEERITPTELLRDVAARVEAGDIAYEKLIVVGFSIGDLEGVRDILWGPRSRGSDYSPSS